MCIRDRIDPFHLEAYGVTTVNYNRDVEIYPVLAAMFEGIYGYCPYKSPTDMGVNMAGNCIIDDEACKEASRQEIIRRYYQALNRLAMDEGNSDEVYKIELLMKQAKIAADMRTVVPAANSLAEKNNSPAAALELPDGRIVTGKTTALLGASAAVLLNAEMCIRDRDLVWSSVICIFMIGATAYAPMPAVLSSAFGNPTVVQLFFLMILMSSLQTRRISLYIGRFFLTRKFIIGRPWAFTAVLFVGSMLIAAFVGCYAPIFLFWPILYDVFEEVGMERHEAYPTIMIILIVVACTLGFPVPPYMNNGLAMISNYATVSQNLLGRCV